MMEATMSHEHRRRQIVLDAVEVVSPLADANAILKDALLMAGRSEIPAISEGFAAFLYGHLLDALESRQGPEVADRFEEGIEVLIRAVATVHESTPAPSGRDHGRLVLVASSKDERVSAITRALCKHVDVEAVAEPDSIATFVWAKLASAVVIDWASCPLDASAIDELTASISTGGRLVLWGAPPEVEERFLEAKDATWLGCANIAPASHVASIVLALLDAA
jgi:hypothetical protein